MADNATVQGLIALANNAGASTEEQRTAALMAVQIMHKHNLSGAPDTSRSFDADFERHCFNIRMKGFYLEAQSKVYDVLREVFGHPAEDAPGYAELNRLCFSLAQLAGDIVLQMPQERMEANLSEMKENVHFVAAAFKDWDERQPPVDSAQLRAGLIELFNAGPVPSNLNSMAAKVHCRVPDVQAMLDQLVADGFLRLKSQAHYQKVKRRPKAKATTVSP